MTLRVDHGKTLAWNTVEHYLAHKPEPRGWNAKRFFESSEIYAHLGKIASKTSAQQPKPLWYAARFGVEEGNAFPVEHADPAGLETGEGVLEPIAEQFEGTEPSIISSGRRWLE